MGGSGGSSGGGSGGYGSLSPAVERLVGQARQKETERLNTQVNEYLSEILISFNGRDSDLANKRLDSLMNVLGDVVEVDKMLLGGSVAKHTDVDGLSDLDALVVLNRADLIGKSPDEVRVAFYKELDATVDRGEVSSVRHGKLAVTVQYRDGMEIQLLPAMRAGKKVAISSLSGDKWLDINPRKFQRVLTSANKKLNNALVPAIKLLKSINSDLPLPRQIKSYHLEVLAVDAARSYSGAMVPRELLIHICRHSATRVLRPISDITGQSRRVDDYMGLANSTQRRLAAQALAGIGRRLEAASSLEEWKTILDQ